MKPAMYIVLNKGLGMSTGKAAAQAGHAAVEAYRISMRDAKEHGRSIYPHRNALELHETNLVRRWYCGGHYMKLVMEARDAEHLRAIQEYLIDRGFISTLIIDEGRTETEPLVPTALAIEIVDKDDPHVAATFSSLDLYREPPPEPLAIIELDRLRENEITTIRERLAAGELPQSVADMVKARRELQQPYEPRRRRWLSRG